MAIKKIAHHNQAFRCLTRNNWNNYDTRQVVFKPAGMTSTELKQGYDFAYQEFYRWSNILNASKQHTSLKHQAKHFFYSAGWKKFEPLWNFVITAKQLNLMTPLLEAILSRISKDETGSITPAELEKPNLPINWTLDRNTKSISQK